MINDPCRETSENSVHQLLRDRFLHPKEQGEHGDVASEIFHEVDSGVPSRSIESAPASFRSRSLTIVAFGRDHRFAGILLQGLLECAPGQHRALHPLREFAHSAHYSQIPEVDR